MDGELIRADLERLDLIGRVVIAVGADVVDIDRIRAVVERQPRFVERVYTRAERDYAQARHDPAERYAARFAAKEAVLKALGTGLGGADFVDIEVERLESGEPRLRLSGRAAERSAELGAVDWLLTLSHSDDRALAIAVAIGRHEADQGSGGG